MNLCVEKAMEKRKKIALLVGQPEEDYQKLFIKGLLACLLLLEFIPVLK